MIIFLLTCLIALNIVSLILLNLNTRRLELSNRIASEQIKELILKAHCTIYDIRQDQLTQQIKELKDEQ